MPWRVCGEYTEYNARYTGKHSIRERLTRRDQDAHDKFSACDDIVPVIWDTKHNTIVSNESSEIIRFLNTVSSEAVPFAFLTTGALKVVSNFCRVTGFQ